MILRASRKPQILVCRMVDTATRIQPPRCGNVSDYVNSAPQNRASATHSRTLRGRPRMLWTILVILAIIALLLFIFGR